MRKMLIRNGQPGVLHVTLPSVEPPHMEVSMGWGSVPEVPLNKVKWNQTEASS